MESLIIEKQNVRMIAHRGLSGLETENTISAFVAAGNRSYFGIACNIHITKDNQFCVFHDDNTSRLANENLIIKDNNYADLYNLHLLDCISEKLQPLHKIPLLTDFIEICQRYEKYAFIELKPVFSKNQIKELIDIIKQYDYLDKCIFASFNLENLILMRHLTDGLQLQYLVSEYNNDVLSNCRKHRLDVGVDFHHLSKENVEKLHKYNIAVNVFTVNNPIVALMLVTWNVDFITSNILE